MMQDDERFVPFKAKERFYDTKIIGVCGRKIKISNATKSEINSVISLFQATIESYTITKHKEKKSWVKN